MNNVKRERLKEIVQEKGWTQKKIAEECKYTQQYINYLLQGKRPIVKDNAVTLGKVLGVDYKYLLGESDYKSVKDYWEKSVEYHNELDRSFYNLLNALQIEVEFNFKQEILKTITSIVDSDLATELVEPKTNYEQVVECIIKTPTGERVVSLEEFEGFKKQILTYVIYQSEEFLK